MQGVLVKRGEGTCRDNLLHCDIFRFAISLEFNCEVGAGDLVMDKGAVLDLEAVPRIEPLQGQPRRSARIKTRNDVRSRENPRRSARVRAGRHLSAEKREYGAVGSL